MMMMMMIIMLFNSGFKLQRPMAIMLIVILATMIGFNDSLLSNIDNSFYSLTNVNNPSNCYRPVKRCWPINSEKCLDIILPYKHTSIEIDTNDSKTSLIDYKNDYLEKWIGLRSIPQCWKSLQIILCASFFPKCDNDTLRVTLPTYDMCMKTKEPCRIVEQYYEWPKFLRCDNPRLFPKKCNNHYNDLKFSNSISTTRCPTSMVSTDDRRIWHPGFDGCALNCVNPIYSEDQHNQASKTIAYGTFLSICFNAFAVCTFMIDRACLKRRFYTLIIFYMNMCTLLSTLGWILQFFKTRDEIVCRPNNTIRYGEPSKSDHFYCCLSFFLIYYFSFASLIWFIHLFRVFHQTFHGLSTGVKMTFRKFHFHMSTWSIPLILTLCILLFGEVDGDSLRGICFVGSLKPMVRFVFVIIPLTIGLMIGIYFSMQTILLLYRTKQKCENGAKRKKNISMALIRIIFFTCSVLIVYLVTTATYIHELTTNEQNLKNFNDHLVCNMNIGNIMIRKNQSTGSIYPINNTDFVNHNDDDVLNRLNLYSNDPDNCSTYEPPNILMIYIQLAAIFLGNILISSWVWTRATISTWKRFYNRHFNTTTNGFGVNGNKKSQQLRLKPYELISETYHLRDQIRQGHAELPQLVSNHNDPVDMDLNSAQSQSVSTNFQQNFSTLLDRRFALCGNDVFLMNANKKQQQQSSNGNANTDANNSTNMFLSSSFVSQNLSISDASQQQLSFESIEQMERNFRNQKRKTRKEREKRNWSRRGSDTSGSLISAAFIASKYAHKLHKRLKDVDHCTDIVTDGHNNGNGTVGDSGNVTKSTSTGDLFKMSLPHLVTSNGTATTMPMIHSPIIAGGPFVDPYHALAMIQNSQPPSAANHQSFNVQHAAAVAAATQMAFMSPNSNIATPNHYPLISATIPNGISVAKSSANSSNKTRNTVRMQENQRVSTFAFTHGMSDQTEHKIVNPLMEKRRPNSVVSSNQQRFIPTGDGSNLAIVVNQAANTSPYGQQPANHPTMANNFILNTLSANSMVSNPQQHPSGGQFFPTNYQIPIITAPIGSGPSIGPYPPFMFNNHLPRYYDTQAAFMAYRQTRMNLDMNEHDKFKGLFTAHQSDSESNNNDFFPINLTESDTSRNENYPDSDHQRLQHSKLVVQQHMKRVEDEVEEQQQQQRAKPDNLDADSAAPNNDDDVIVPVKDDIRKTNQMNEPNH